MLAPITRRYYEKVIVYFRLIRKVRITNEISFEWDLLNLRQLETKLQEFDLNFKIPTVLYLYRLYCNVNYECFSIARSYNKIMQLLFSGNLSNLNSQCCNRLKRYDVVCTSCC